MMAAYRSMAFMLGFVLLWAAIEWIAGGLLARYSAYQVVWSRYLVHLVCMIILVAPRSPRRLVVTRRPFYQLARSMMMLIMPAAWIIGLQAGIVQNVLAAFWSSPLLVLALSALFLREGAHPLAWLAAAVGGIAAALIFAGGAVPVGAQWLAVGGMAGSFSVYVVMTRSLRNEDVTANLFYTAFGVLIALTPVMPAVWQAPRLADLPIFAAVGGFGLVALWMLDRAAAAAPLGLAAPLILAQVPFSLTLGWLAGHGHPDKFGLACLIVVCAACLVPLIVALPRKMRWLNP
jgi:drug/metabolite transporter (DMT)-like permease